MMTYQKQLEQLNKKYQELLDENLDSNFDVVGLDYILREFQPWLVGGAACWKRWKQKWDTEEREERKEQAAKKSVLWFKEKLREMDDYLREPTYDRNYPIWKWTKAADYIQAQFDSATELRPSKPTKSAGMVATLH